MRLFLAMLMLMTSAALFSQVDCNLFNIQDLAADYLSFGVDTVILQSDGSYEIQLSNGTTASITFGCTDPDYTEYDASATTDDGSCSTLIVEGCTNPAYFEFDASANTDDGSCASLIGCEDLSPTMDGYTYGVVAIGEQCWFAENLRTTVYADGSAIPEVTHNLAWAGLTMGARCDHNNNVNSVVFFGRLYNGYAVANGAGLCPTGWHVATDDEWTDLENHISSQGFSGTEGTALKSMSGWGDFNGTDDFGFSALPGRYRNSNDGYFGDAGLDGNWWSSSPSGGNAWYRVLSYDFPFIFRYYSGSPRSGFSVRCLWDAE